VKVRAMSLRFALAAAAAFAALSADAGLPRPVGDDAAWRAECGSCHAAYPPALLSAAAWRQVMGTLDRHYGSDASVEASLAARIGAFVEANAGAADRAAPPSSSPGSRLPRITDGRWFAREHREVSAATLARPDVRGLGNCGACHANADRGRYSEHDLRNTYGRTFR
jgi:hypothetical protein